MAKLTLSRRSFLKASAATCAVAASAGFAQPLQALADGGESSSASEVKRIRTSCRGCGKIECGLWVTVQDGKVIKIEGDESSPGTRGHTCIKSQSSAQACYHPDRVRYHLVRVSPKGEKPEWRRVSFDEAAQICATKFKEVQEKYGGNAIFTQGGTGRLWSMAPYAGFKVMLGTSNAWVAYQVCKGPRHLGGLLVDEHASPWMEVEQEPSVYIQWGTAVEYSNYDCANRSIVDVMNHADTHILVDPRMTPGGKDADIWLPLRPGTDGALALGWTKWVIDNDATDDLFVRRWTNAPFLWVEDKEPTKDWYAEGNGGIISNTRLLTEADLVEGGSAHRFMVWDEANDRLTYWDVDEGMWENELHKIPTTGQWIKSPMAPLQRDAWLPDPSTFADPATEPERFVGSPEDSNPLGLPKQPALFPGEIDVVFKDGSQHKARTVWDGYYDVLKEYTLERVEEITGVPPEKNEAALRAWTTRKNPSYGNGGIHFQLAPDQNGNSICNTRALQILSIITGNGDGPAGNRGGTKTQIAQDTGTMAALPDANYGDAAITWPGRDWSIDEVADHLKTIHNPHKEQGDDPSDWYRAARLGGKLKPSSAWPNPVTNFERNSGKLDAERFPVLRYWTAWTDASTLIDGMRNNDVPYPIKAGIGMSGDFMSMSNSLMAYEGIMGLDFFVDVDLWHCPNSDLADVIFAPLHWLEQDCPRCAQGSMGFFGANVACVEPTGDCMSDMEIHSGLWKAMGIPYNMVYPEYGEWPDTSGVCSISTRTWVTPEYPEGIGWEDYKKKFQEEGWFDARKYFPERWGTYRRHEMGWRRQVANQGFAPLVDMHPGFMTASGLCEIWSMPLEAYSKYEEDKFPVYREPNESPVSTPEKFEADNAFLMTTGSRQPVYFHSEHRQLPWCREQWPVPRVEMNPADAARLGIEQGDWVWIETDWGKVREVADLYHGISEGVINANHAWWCPEFDQQGRGFDLVSINCVMNPYNQDEICGAETLRSTAVRVYKATPENSPFGNPCPCDDEGNPMICDASDERLKAWLPGGPGLQKVEEREGAK